MNSVVILTLSKHLYITVKSNALHRVASYLECLSSKNAPLHWKKNHVKICRL